jgi:pimeloyl-ACP methyl ester carboxylesterase
MNPFLIVLLFFSSLVENEVPHPPTPPTQPDAGPGGRVYAHAEVRFTDRASTAEGYWLFEPAAPQPDSAQVVVFNHGYGAYNPMIYGAWIKHLVRQGHTVIFPRYQKNLISPWPSGFFDNAARGIRNAMTLLETEPERVRPKRAPFIMVGHSYGGTISAYLSVHHKKYGLPAPDGLMLCAPGTGPFKAGKLDSYDGLPRQTNLLLLINENDRVVGEKFQFRIFETARQVQRRNLLIQRADDYGTPSISATHSECYAVDMAFDSGTRSPSALRALRIGEAGPVDYYAYWKLLDGMIDCVNSGNNCNYAFGATALQRSLGEWSDGRPVEPLDVVRR